MHQVPHDRIEARGGFALFRYRWCRGLCGPDEGSFLRGYRQLTIGRKDRTATSLPEHLGIIEALEARDTELAEKRARDHTLGLAAYVEAHGQELFT